MQFGSASVTANVVSTATASAFADAVSRVSGIEMSSLGVTRTISNTAAGQSQYSWTVTFPQQYGRASLLQASTFCVTTTALSSISTYDSEMPTHLTAPGRVSVMDDSEDIWSGTSCTLLDSHVMRTQRLVPGQSSLTGSFAVTIGKDTLKVPLRTAAASLQSELRSLTSGDGTSKYVMVT